MNTSKKNNAPERVNYEKKVCNEFKKNDFLLSSTKDEKLNIILYRKSLRGKRPSVLEVCNELEFFLKFWFQNKPISFESKYIRKIAVTKTIYRNVVYFSNISRCIPIDWNDLRFSIQEKNQKYNDYCKNIKCDEYWLCICLPFEENRNLNIIDYDEKENEALEFLNQSPFLRICITSDLGIDQTNINWIKGAI